MTNFQKFDEELDKYTFTLKGGLMNSKHPQLINVARNLKKRLLKLREPGLDGAIDYDKAVEILVQEYLDFADYLMNNIFFNGEMTKNFTLEEKIEYQEPLEDEETVEEPKTAVIDPLEPLKDVSTESIIDNMFKPKKNVKKATIKRKPKSKTKK